MISVQPLGFSLFFNPGSRCLPINIFLNWKLPWEVGGWSRYQTKGLAVSGLDLSLCLKALGNGNKYRSLKKWCGPEPELSKKDKENCLPTTIVKHLALCIWHAFNIYLLSLQPCELGQDSHREKRRNREEVIRASLSAGPFQLVFDNILNYEFLGVGSPCSFSKVFSP